MLLLSELRPNNLYQIKNNIIVSLEDHLNDGTQMLLYFHGLQSGVDFKEVWPIPLTDDWLRQLGLVERYVKNEWSWANCTRKGEWGSDTEIHNDGGIYYYNVAYPPIQYVHQLQNLYAALTREELPYKAELLKPSKEFARIEYLENGLRTISDNARDGAAKIFHLTKEDSIIRDMYGKLHALHVLANDLIKGKL